MIPSIVAFDAEKLDFLMGETPVDNPFHLTGIRNWQSELSGMVLKNLAHISEVQAEVFSSFGLPGELFTNWMKPLVQITQKDTAASNDPDLISRDNSRIEAEYAAGISTIMKFLVHEENGKMAFDRGKCLWACKDADGQAWLSGRLAAQQLLEWQYHSAGQTRLGAMKHLLRSLVQVIANDVLPEIDRQPYRKTDKSGNPLISDSEYLQECEKRLLALLEHDAIDIRRYAHESPEAKLGACPWIEVEGSRRYSIILRHYPLPKGVKANGKVLYMASPMINRCDIYDLAPQKSVVEGMLAMGYTIYMVDHGNPEEDQKDLPLSFYGKTIHDEYLAIIEKKHPGQIIEVMAYCMAGTMFVPYLARRIEEAECTGKAVYIRQLVLLTAPILFDDEGSGHKPMRDVIREQYDEGILSDFFSGSNVPPQTIELGMHGIQPGVAFSVTEGFYMRAHFPGAVADAAPFMNWLHYGTRFPARAHREWIRKVFMENQIWNGNYILPSSVPDLDGKPVDLSALDRGKVAIFDYRGQRDPIAPTGSCITSEFFGRRSANKQMTRGGLNRTIERNVGHIFVVSKKLLAEFLETVESFLNDNPPPYTPKKKSDQPKDAE